MSDDKDAESGWDGLAILLWPVLAFMKVKAWVHNRLHPSEPEEL